jgi:peroxin-10
MRDKFPLAGAPDMVRSNQKDEYYVNHLESLLRDVGVFNQSTKVYSELLYYILTYGCNSMTLGEEYCDIQQVFKGLNPSLILKVEYIFFKFSSFLTSSQSHSSTII